MVLLPRLPEPAVQAHPERLECVAERGAMEVRGRRACQAAQVAPVGEVAEELQAEPVARAVLGHPEDPEVLVVRAESVGKAGFRAQTGIRCQPKPICVRWVASTSTASRPFLVLPNSLRSRVRLAEVQAGRCSASRGRVHRVEVEAAGAAAVAAAVEAVAPVRREAQGLPAARAAL